MTYLSSEESISEGVPVECYEFTGGGDIWRYTSYDWPVELKGNVYTPMPISRGPFSIPTVADRLAELEVTLSAETELAKKYAFSDYPPARLKMTIYRSHYKESYDEDDYHIILWNGKVISVKTYEGKSIFLGQSFFDAGLAREIPTTWYQTSCNHVLYDKGCRVDPAAHMMNIPVARVNENKIVFSRPLGADNVYSGGIVRVARTGEMRSIVENDNSSLIVGYPFADIVVRDNLYLLKGCDHTLRTCKAKFNNVRNYGGFPTIPYITPFGGGSS